MHTVFLFELPECMVVGLSRVTKYVATTTMFRMFQIYSGPVFVDLSGLN